MSEALQRLAQTLRVAALAESKLRGLRGRIESAVNPHGTR